MGFPRIKGEVSGAVRGLRSRVRISSMPGLTQATAETWTEVDGSTDANVELEGLPSAMCHLMSVVPNPIDDAIVAV